MSQTSLPLRTIVRFFIPTAAPPGVEGMFHWSALIATLAAADPIDFLFLSPFPAGRSEILPNASVHE